jgi:hypothetical protein
VAHFHDALGAFTHHGKRLRENRIQAFSLRDACLEGHGLVPQGLIAQALQRGLKRIDALDGLAVLFKKSLIATAKYLGK